MFRFDTYLEKWAQAYPSILHNPAKGSKNNRFFRLDSANRLEDFCKSLTATKSPAVGAITAYEAHGNENGKKFWYEHTALIFTKQTEGNIKTPYMSTLAAADAKEEGINIAFDILSWILYDKSVNNNPTLQGIQSGTWDIYTNPQCYNGWWITALTIEDLGQRNLCVSKDYYADIEK